MRFETLEEAIALVHQTGYGLTSGLHSLDEREQAEWREGIRAGNLYHQQPTAGAIVLRQPFGGMGKSAFGPGLKAGGPNYVAQFIRFHEADAGWRLRRAARRLPAAWDEEFGGEHDPCQMLGEENIRRYLPVSAGAGAGRSARYGLRDLRPRRGGARGWLPGAGERAARRAAAHGGRRGSRRSWVADRVSSGDR